MMKQTQSLQVAQYRVAQYYLDYLRSVQRAYLQGSESTAYALSLFDQEREQVKQWQAWVVAHARQDDRAAAFCSDYVQASPDIFRLRLLPQEYIAWLRSALQVARGLSNRRAEATHLFELSEVSTRVGEAHHAIEYARQALDIARQIDNQPLVALGLNLCGNASRDLRMYEEAQAYYEQSLVLYQTIGDRKGMAEAFNNLAVLALIHRNNAAAQDYLEQNLALYRAIGDQEGIASSLNNLGFLAIRLGNYAAATDRMEQALTVFQVLGDKQGITVALINLGAIANAQREYSLAREYLEQSLAIAREVGLLDKEEASLRRLGEVAMAQGDMLLAGNYFEQSLDIARRSIRTSTSSPINLSNLAIIYMQLQQEDRACATLREALQAACSLPAEHYKLIVLVAAARVWVLRGKPLQAAIWLGLVENHPHPAVQMADIKRDLQVARAECTVAISQEQFAAAWEAGKNLNLDTVVEELLSEWGKD